VQAPQPGTLRLTLAREGASVLADDGTGLGIVVNPCPAPAPLAVDQSNTDVTVTCG